MSWSQEEAINFCRIIEPIAERHGCHVALTGGTLYKQGDRKDCDLLFYRIRQVPEIDVAGLFKSLEQIGMKRGQSFSDWLIKAEHLGKSVDCFFPEGNGDECWVEGEPY